MKSKYEVKIEVPDKVQVNIESSIVKVKGPKGENERIVNNPRIEVLKENNFLVLRTRDNFNSVQADKVFMNSIEAHLKNMFKGVLNNYIAKVKVCSGHFPMQVKAEAGFISIKNFLGEKIPRKARIIGKTKTEIKGDIIEITGTDKEHVSQTAANLEQATRITNRDRRIFQDGCFIIATAGEAA